MNKITVLSLAFISIARAACPNSCSGHGTCGVDEVCTCYPGWGMGGKEGGDCSERFCPFELAWVDGPNSVGDTHKYAECANKGICDRETAECDCFPGYEGKACGRQSCPLDCSGHGTCEFMKDLTFGIVYNEYYDGSVLSLTGLGTGGKMFTDYSWDTDRARACVCDGGWTGLACNKRMCPMGNDIMDVIPNFDETSIIGMAGYGNELAQVQTVTLHDAGANNLNFGGKSFAIQFTSKLNETYVTQPIMWSTTDATLAAYIEEALEKLPNKVVDDVSVSVNSGVHANGVVISVTFTGAAVQGKQHKLEILKHKCNEGCNPRVTCL
mmetsp:Transcript_6096/g.9083  ORF Transcript_6096/g.9083 Transcript_6096/m.9083 type:complete len:325 (-) Transcript_6096:51-1025(-)